VVKGCFCGGFGRQCAQNVVVDGYLVEKSVASVASGRRFLGFEKHATFLRFSVEKFGALLVVKRKKVVRALRECPTHAMRVHEWGARGYGDF
jgi:hypothetical protein